MCLHGWKQLCTACEDFSNNSLYDNDFQDLWTENLLTSSPWFLSVPQITPPCFLSTKPSSPPFIKGGGTLFSKPTSKSYYVMSWILKIFLWVPWPQEQQISLYSELFGQISELWTFLTYSDADGTGGTIWVQVSVRIKILVNVHLLNFRRRLSSLEENSCYVLGFQRFSYYCLVHQRIKVRPWWIEPNVKTMLSAFWTSKMAWITTNLPYLWKKHGFCVLSQFF